MPVLVLLAPAERSPFPSSTASRSNGPDDPQVDNTRYVVDGLKATTSSSSIMNVKSPIPVQRMAVEVVDHALALPVLDPVVPRHPGTLCSFTFPYRLRQS